MSRHNYIRLQLLITTYLSVLFPRPNMQAHFDTQSEAGTSATILPLVRHTKTSICATPSRVKHPVNICLVSCMRDPALTPNAAIMRMRARGTCERLKRGRLQNKTFFALSILGLVEENDHDMFERREHMVRVFEASGLRFWSTPSSFVGSLSFNRAFQTKNKGSVR
ncbi:hypothetical protein ACHAO4_001636 [Trichoderma viride]